MDLCLLVGTGSLHKWRYHFKKVRWLTINEKLMTKSSKSVVTYGRDLSNIFFKKTSFIDDPIGKQHRPG